MTDPSIHRSAAACSIKLLYWLILLSSVAAICREALTPSLLIVKNVVLYNCYMCSHNFRYITQHGA